MFFYVSLKLHFVSVIYQKINIGDLQTNVMCMEANYQYKIEYLLRAVFLN